MEYRDIITVEADKRGGRACIRGLRITVGDVLSYVACGMSEDEIVSDFPDLTREDVRACLAYAADCEGDGSPLEIGFGVDQELKAVLLAAMARCDRGEKIGGEELLEELRRDDERWL
jgi:uncharacterized protein (DUF433 family)